MIRSLYNKTKKKFVLDVELGFFIEEMSYRAQVSHFSPSDAETTSWKRNSDQLVRIIKDLPDDIFVAFEINSPVGGRIDCMLFGKGQDGKKNIVHIELKQWSNENIKQADYDKNLYEVFIGGSTKDETHPCYQAENYDIHLRNFIRLFDDEENYRLTGLAYCYNYDSEDGKAVLFEDQVLLNNISLFSKDKKEDLKTFLGELLCRGEGEEIYREFEACEPKPTKNLIFAAANMFSGTKEQTEFRLLEGQDASCERIFNEIERCKAKNEKSVIIVQGGPGTGKTVIALHILSKLAKTGNCNNFFYATRSTALVEQLSKALSKIPIAQGRVNAAGDLIRSVYDFKPNNWKESEVDVLLIDEAHRVSESSNAYWDNNGFTYLRQSVALMYCAKVSVFFIDDLQAVQPQEIGNSQMIEDAAMHYKKYIESDIAKGQKDIAKTNVKLQKKQNSLGTDAVLDKEFTKSVSSFNRRKDGIALIKSCYNGSINVIHELLTAQFRCNGSDAYLHWIDNVFSDIADQRDIPFSKKDYDIQIYDNPNELYAKIKSLDNYEPIDGSARVIARLVAGWCWEWKRSLDENGRIWKEVVIGEDFKMPWETQVRPRTLDYDEQGNEIRYAPSAQEWATHRYGINQIGCNPSSQGFEFDYVGVILGPDITVDSTKGLVGVTGINYDNKIRNKTGEELTTLIRNIYRVLMTRGKKGCYIYCCNPEVADYFRKYLPKE